MTYIVVFGGENAETWKWSVARLGTTNTVLAKTVRQSDAQAIADALNVV